MTAPSAPIEDVAPDWESAHTPDVPCPLCGYSLRGLAEPRCPECGYRATSWAALIEQNNWRHPFLFEHNPRRPIRSFARTLLASLRPIKLFSSVLRAEQRIRSRWLLVYLLLSQAIAVIAMTVVVGWPVYWAWQWWWL